MEQNKIQGASTARLATLDELIHGFLQQQFSPVPSREVLREWFDAAKIPRFKSNPTAKRGGGPCFYSVAAVEKFLRARTLPKMGGAS
jgi:trehalose utilization protein